MARNTRRKNCLGGDHTSKGIDDVSVCIIIPCLNEEKHIGLCLDSLIANDFRKDRMRILVIDGMSTDNTRAIVEEYCNNYGYIKMMNNPRKITPVALNIGIKESKEDLIIRIDGHSSCEQDYISKLVKGLYQYDADNIGGIVLARLGKTSRSKAVGSVFSHYFGAGNAHYRIGSDRIREVDSVFPGCYRAEVFDRIGYFNENLIRTQDREFNHRLKEAGGRIILDPSIKCIYYPRDTIVGYCKWNYRGAFWLFYSRGLTDTKMISLRNLVPPIFVALQIVLIVLYAIKKKTYSFFLFPIYLYWVLVLVFSAQISIELRSKTLVPLSLLIFTITHYGYGIGAILGWAKSASLKRGVRRECLTGL